MASNGKTSESISDLNEKKQLIGDRLQKRQEERQAEVKRRQDEKDLTDAVQETTKCFEETFKIEKEKLEFEINKSDNMESSKYVEHFDNLSNKLNQLQKFVSESTMFLSPYEINRAKQTVSQLQATIQAKRDERIPKKKFAFKAKKSEKAKEPTPSFQPNDQPKVTSSLEVGLAECKFLNISDAKLEKHADELNQKDVALVGLTGCVVKLFGAPSAIHVNKLTNCSIFSGPVSGSVFIRECINCTFMVPCQQLRIHTTRDSDFYIHVTSKAIVEDCQKTRFAPYNWSYSDINEHYNVSGLNRARNNWDKVDDFNWLASGTQSPNWSIIQEGERKRHCDIIN